MKHGSNRSFRSHSIAQIASRQGLLILSNPFAIQAEQASSSFSAPFNVRARLDDVQLAATIDPFDVLIATAKDALDLKRRAS